MKLQHNWKFIFSICLDHQKGTFAHVWSKVSGYYFYIDIGIWLKRLTSVNQRSRIGPPLTSKLAYLIQKIYVVLWSILIHFNSKDFMLFLGL